MREKGIILLLEDNLKILDLNRRMLEKEGLMVLAARTIDEARARMKIAIPDVAVFDIMLPDGSGLDFLNEFRRVCDAPVLFLTAKTERADVLAGLTLGGNDYILKPYDIDEFRARVMGFFRLVDSARTHKIYSAKMSPLLSERELYIALCAAEGMTNKDIARKVYLSESRVKTCMSGVYRKLGIAEEKEKRNLLAKLLNV